MFNMGGPIKEGVMHGIREPHRHGRRVGYAEGTPGWGKYFQNIFKKSGPVVKQVFGKKFKPVVGAMDQIAKQKWLQSLHPSRIKETVSGIGGSGAGQTFMQNLRSFPGLSKIPGWATKAKDLAVKYPKTTALTALYGGPTVIEAGKNIPWSGIGEFLDPRPGWKKAFGIEEEVKEKITDKDGVGTIQDNITWTPSGTGSTTPILTQSMKDKVAATKSQRQKKKMLEIMGYDDSKKDAAYNALIDASQIIAAAPGGKSLDISRDIIQPAIAATSKQFDKPKDIKEAVGLLMAKGEIEKDVAAGKGSATKQTATDLVNAGVFKTEKAALAHLAKTESIAEKAITYASSMKKPIDQEIVIYTMTDQFGSRPNVLKSEDEMEKLQKADNYESDLAEFEFIKEDKSLGPGSYVIGRSGFVINSDGTVKQVL
jgi:hypothetical protein